jgi:hypothetical protein
MFEMTLFVKDLTIFGIKKMRYKSKTSLSFLFAEMIYTFIYRDLIDPCRNSCITSEFFKGSVNFNKYFLAQIFRIMMVLNKTKSCIKYFILVLKDELLKGYVMGSIQNSVLLLPNVYFL